MYNIALAPDEEREILFLRQHRTIQSSAFWGRFSPNLLSLGYAVFPPKVLHCNDFELDKRGRGKK
jgi:hypothetical protein